MAIDLPSSLGIEAVEVAADGGRTVTVRVTGRWRRRRTELRGQAILVVEAEGGRRRFAAMPEPPSLNGAAPGTWRMSFAVPAELAPRLPGRTFLQLGGVMVPLPVGEVSAPPGLRDPPASEEPVGQVARLEDELARARAQIDRLHEAVAERERRLRAADQHVHAEAALRAEVEQELSRRLQAAEQDRRGLQQRVSELERELGRMRRRLDESEHLVAVAKAARPDAGHEAARLERELAGLRAELGRQRDRCARAYEAIALVRAELRGPAGAPPSAAPPDPPRPPAHPEPPAPGEPTQAAPASGQPIQAVPASGEPTQAAPASGEPIQAERLTEALTRLRERTTPSGRAEEIAQAPPAEMPATVPARPAKPWLAKAFRALAARDPTAAGRLVLALLPAQGAAYPGPLVYDLVLSDVLCAHVTVGGAAAHVEFDATARAPSEIDFRLVGDLAGVARLLAAGRLRRRLARLPAPRQLARIHGDRRRVEALDHLVGAPLTIDELRAAGVKLDPVLALTVAALMIDPEWTAGERFTVAQQDPSAPAPSAYLQVRDGKPPLPCAEPPHGPVATVFVCPGDALLAVLAGADGSAEVVGEQRPAMLLRRWLDRAQCG